MKVEVKDGSIERRILSGMITDDKVLSKIASKWGEGDLFRSVWANMVASWCVRFYRKYDEAPRRSIIGLYETWAKTKKRNPDTVQMVETFLSSLADEYDSTTNPQHVVDEAGSYFHSVRLARLSDTITANLEAGAIEEADHAVRSHSRIELGVGHGIDLFSDETSVKAALDEDILEPLVHYPDGLGRFMHNHLSRDSFVVFAAPQKGAKTYWLIDVAWHAMIQRKRVAFFEVGDLTDRQIDRRFLERASLKPSRSIDGRWPYTVNYPVSIEPPKKDRGSTDKLTASIKTVAKVFKKPLTYPIAWEACQRVMLEKVKSKKSYFRRSFHPNLSISILGIKSIIEGWITDGWIPDVVVIDYADNLAPVDRKEDPRDRVNTTWKLMRALSQELRCLLVTATQVKASGFTTWCLDRRHFSEDNRKLSHCTAMIGINTTPAEKEKGISRLNCIVGREGDNSVHRFCYTAGCLGISHPSIVSVY